MWILLKQETVSGSGISWAICKSAPQLNQSVWSQTAMAVQEYDTSGNTGRHTSATLLQPTPTYTGFAFAHVFHLSLRLREPYIPSVGSALLLREG